MSALVTLDRVCLKPNGKSLSFELRRGEMVVVLGPSASGKSHLLEICAGVSNPASGKVIQEGSVHFCGDPVFPRRATPLSLARSVLPKNDNGRAVEVLTTLSLLEWRDDSVTRLSPSQMIASTLAAPLSLESGAVVIDGHLDLLDPWTLDAVLDHLRRDRRAGKAVLLSTNRPDIVERADQAIILRDEEAVFAGSIAELTARLGPTELIVECDDPSAVQAMVEPFVVSARIEGSSLHLSAHKGQALAARLLTHGYGRVVSVTLKSPTLMESLLDL